MKQYSGGNYDKVFDNDTNSCEDFEQPALFDLQNFYAITHVQLNIKANGNLISSLLSINHSINQSIQFILRNLSKLHYLYH